MITTMSQFLTAEQIQQALQLKTAKAIHEQIIEPNLAQINEKIGQENNAVYLAYLCEHIIGLVFRATGE